VLHIKTKLIIKKNFWHKNCRGWIPLSIIFQQYHVNQSTFADSIFGSKVMKSDEVWHGQSVISGGDCSSILREHSIFQNYKILFRVYLTMGWSQRKHSASYTL
jgi:hypothetical protein